MKKLSLTPAKLLILVSAVLFVIFWSVWFFCYRHYLIWLEGYSFFSTLPDFLPQYLGAKEGIPGYIGAFLHQFYAMPALGAAIQAFLTICYLSSVLGSTSVLYSNSKYRFNTSDACGGCRY